MATQQLQAAGSIVALSPEMLAASGGPSSLLWLVNICRPSCGFCQALTPRWEQLAKQLRHEVVVGSWDAHAHQTLPPLLGEANATPTIRAVVPSATGGARLVDYDGSRQVADLASFAAALMPSFVTVVEDQEAWDRAGSSAAAWRLPRMLCFVRRRASSTTPPLLKALSSTLRGQLLVLEVRVHSSTPRTAAIAERLGVNATPAVLWLHSAAHEREPVWHDGPPTFRRLRAFADEMLARRPTGRLEGEAAGLHDGSIQGDGSPAALAPAEHEDADGGEVVGGMDTTRERDEL